MEAWDEGSQYEEYMGRWSRLVAREFLAWLGVPAGAVWLDVGCGTGALSGEILVQSAPLRVIALDPSAEFLATARSRLGDRLDLQVGDAGALPFGADEFDATVSGLVLNFVPDPLAAVRELRRVTKGGGVVGLYVWDYAEGMEMIRAFWDVAKALDPSSAELDEARRFPLCHPQRLRDLFEDAGLEHTEVRGIEVPTVFESFDDFWRPMLGGQGPAPSYVASLDASSAERLRAELERELIRVDGQITLAARAWAIKGVA